MATSLSGHTLELAHELLDDIELSRLPPEALLLKSRRLARLVGAEEVGEWLRFELNEYPNNELGRKYMTRMGRWTDQAKQEGYWMPLAGLEGNIAAMEVQIQQLQIPNIHYAPSSSNPNEYVTGLGANRFTQPISDILVRLNNLTSAVAKLRGIRSRTLSALHDFAASHYYELAFSGVAESIFESHKATVDTLLAASAADAVKKVPAIYDRLATGDPEAVSQALNSCRRMIKAFADAVYPAGDTAVGVDGQTYQIGSDKVLRVVRDLRPENVAPVGAAESGAG
jgi:hypothetical protein